MSNRIDQHQGNPWSTADLEKLREYAGQNMPVAVIGVKLGRRPQAVREAAAAEEVSLEGCPDE